MSASWTLADTPDGVVAVTWADDGTITPPVVDVMVAAAEAEGLRVMATTMGPEVVVRRSDGRSVYAFTLPWSPGPIDGDLGPWPYGGPGDDLPAGAVE
ncbi:MAG: hypothetical protein LC792_21475 [Actinobacteria bacterium]|nr:hypothetical protein [Actinomycetota bacterium]